MDKKNRRDYGDSSLILVAIATLSEKPVGFRQRVVHTTVYSQKTGAKMAIKYAFYCLDKERN